MFFLIYVCSVKNNLNIYRMYSVNSLRFSLFQGSILLCETIMEADLFGQPIDVRPLLGKSISKLQRVLSKQSYNFGVEVGEGKSYDLVGYPEHKYNVWGADGYDPQPVNKVIGELKLNGVECKIRLHINDKLIVERDFYVKGFNGASRYSYDVTYAVREITDSITRNIKWMDYDFMWNEWEKEQNARLISEFNS